jgi:hypothetical protein
MITHQANHLRTIVAIARNRMKDADFVLFERQAVWGFINLLGHDGIDEYLNKLIKRLPQKDSYICKRCGQRTKIQNTCNCLQNAQLPL